jgi:hypothetical protein
MKAGEFAMATAAQAATTETTPRKRAHKLFFVSLLPITTSSGHVYTI